MLFRATAYAHDAMPEARDQICARRLHSNVVESSRVYNDAILAYTGQTGGQLEWWFRVLVGATLALLHDPLSLPASKLSGPQALPPPGLL